MKLRHVVSGTIEVAAAARARPDMDCCGDAFGWVERPTHLTIVLADGLGHGEAAQAAADQAVEAITDREVGDGAPDELLRRCHAAMTRTRGGAVAILRVDRARSELAFCGVGNIAIRETPRRGGRGTSLPGIVGLRLPSLRVFTSRLEPRDLVVLTTDGIESRFDPDRERFEGSLPDLASAALQRWALDHDDASVVAVRRATPAIQPMRGP